MSAKLIPVQTQTTINFDGERDFRLILQNGFERHFYWELNETPSPTTIQHTIYTELDETWCEGEITPGMEDLISVCRSMIDQMNGTNNWIQQAEEAKADREIYENMYEICEDRRKTKIRDTCGYCI